MSHKTNYLQSADKLSLSDLIGVLFKARHDGDEEIADWLEGYIDDNFARRDDWMQFCPECGYGDPSY